MSFPPQNLKDIPGNAFHAYRGVTLHLYALKDVLEVSDSEPAMSTRATRTDWQNWLLVACYWILVTRCLLLDSGYSLLTAYPLLSTNH